jgi:hypothetical protein
MSCFQGSAEKLRAELRVVESEKKALQEHYLQATERVSQLETELDKASIQIRLLQAEQSRCEDTHRVCPIFCHLKVGHPAPLPFVQTYHPQNTTCEYFPRATHSCLVYVFRRPHTL